MTSWSIYLLVAPVMINAELAIGQVDDADSNDRNSHKQRAKTHPAYKSVPIIKVVPTSSDAHFLPRTSLSSFLQRYQCWFQTASSPPPPREHADGAVATMQNPTTMRHHVLGSRRYRVIGHQ